MSEMQPRVVMLIEDNPDHVLLIQTMLEDCPVVRQVMVLGDGEQALNYIRIRGAAGEVEELPGIILLDLKLPRVDGLDVLRALRASAVWCRVPVIMLTTSTRSADEIASFSNGANAYVAKVMPPSELNRRLQQLVRDWVGRDSGWQVLSDTRLPVI